MTNHKLTKAKFFASLPAAKVKADKELEARKKNTSTKTKYMEL